ncbi:MAG: peptide deformylase [Candidatus Doudnabacteria bacterium RIFCSPLOWO2_02_FULL_49_13]|uniref:Peptide deformylase n=1 Tax=Candidatus Doudnabacteria bacterium RIFCSPHIGHO2_12_FULL_48_16 TaxID=1817838 RepID=A0A1F5PKY5_9BACT|nr:MAG: peptide deformylase [Candidatus Doudnabacteria bacterium RIFCSPHIGHO2_02_FULL_49_24]OGE89095.1 MAG: peptide deformylase [Candidatus Doudnabacteria bacterium RIFCSPHIGHO2_01_FULL_50_67]OGE90576.1 MAG: peptide deformylase [Candidatus Doudnabacteria bacterium RIFCSPHIGHO2_12_FULL_48_16]OGE97613.1 MAG: peptide deformylase [Candidatus Doudnabacteria bacterium RIFCSPLOWO2_01_FULL_49_40]OGF02968.1 MAG: peptide deformylase [Candidatus Doudnabacteria bacterium RIFCSPLOWO2_02_FULL_49_13]OGF03552
MLKIVQAPNPILNKKTTLVKKIDDELVKLADEMIKTSRVVNGIGLAAPQIGKSIRFCIINLEHLGLPPFALVNPKIVTKSWKKVELEEGCLSIPGIFGIVKRPVEITVEAQNLDGKKHKFDADGMLSRVIQHEVDHLDGILFTSKIIRKTSGKPDEKM